MAQEFIHDAANSRYIVTIDGSEASTAIYQLVGNEIRFTETFTPQEYRGKGYAGALVAYAVDDVEKTTDYRVVPVCPFVVTWFDTHPEKNALLTR